MGSMQILNAIKAKVEVPKVMAKGLQFVEVYVRGNRVLALVDTGATHNFVSTEEAKRLGIKEIKEGGMMKTNSRSLSFITIISFNYSIIGLFDHFCRSDALRNYRLIIQFPVSVYRFNDDSVKVNDTSPPLSSLHSNSNSNSNKKVVCRDNNAMGTQKAKVSFHNPWIRRPQDEYKILVNNSNSPFEHVWLDKSEDGSRFIHPLEKYSVMDFVDKTVSNVEPVKPLPVESISFKLVQDVKGLKDLAAKLRDADEFAVDLEHNQYRSFQGLTCLMQISTRTEYFIVDTLKLRVQIGPYLRDVFKDPTKRKVMHGADRDIIWLQRDFAIYVCNMFDTGQASRVLKLERNSLEYLLHYFCNVSANKEYQNADWRLRPLTDEMLRYAREDTHYLLYIYDLMKRLLLSSSIDPECPETALIEVYQRSYDVCMHLYQKELLTENSYLSIYGLHAADLNGQQLAIVAGLCEWRDRIARSKDESTGFILPNKSLIEIAKQIPLTPAKLCDVLKSRHPYIERNLGSVVSIIRHSMQNASAFDPVALKLKEKHIELMAARNDANFANGEDECSQTSKIMVELKKSKDDVEELKQEIKKSYNENEKLKHEIKKSNNELAEMKKSKSEIEEELKKLKIQMGQWRKAAEVATAMLYDVAENKNDRLVGTQIDDECSKRKNGSVLKRFRVLWKCWEVIPHRSWTKTNACI
ncbi:protein RRP6-like 1 [Rutidosis leptorrhynchoides]|uniref:protein RRP6-like 1 n=1 Tax=Rutidosis leptorrhynchoides TaxID=125765 RepID=UPI003A9A2388